MEQKLNSLFDFQRFQQNPKLKNVVQDVEGRYAAALDDDDLDLVSAAAGDIYMADRQEGILIHPGLEEGKAR